MAECMTTSKAAASSSSASCPICTNNFDEISDTVALPCGHVFHSHCSAEWFKQSQTCPQCRSRLRNPQMDQTKIFLSFGDQDSRSGGCIGSEEEVAGLAELRAKLAAATMEQEIAKQKARRSRHRDLMARRELNQKQRLLEDFSTQLRSCQESLAQQESENGQLMQLLAQDYEELSDEARKLRLQLDEERLERKKLDERLQQLETQIADQKRQNARMLEQLQESQQDALYLMEKLEAEKSRSDDLSGRIIALEAESFQLSKRLNNGHAVTSRLLLCGHTKNPTQPAGADNVEVDREFQFGSLPVLPIVVHCSDSDSS